MRKDSSNNRGEDCPTKRRDGPDADGLFFPNVLPVGVPVHGSQKKHRAVTYTSGSLEYLTSNSLTCV
jgi:hypothetical protein